MSAVLVTGGCGAIGSRLVGRLVAEGERVRVLDRAPAAGLPAGVELISADLGDRAALAAAVGGTATVFHLAALAHVTDPTAEQLREYERVNVEGTRSVVRAARDAGVSRLVFFSTINVYGPTRPGEVHDEGSPLRPSSPYAQSKAAAERAALDAAPAVVLRLAAVYGSTVKGNYARLLDALRRRRFVKVGSGRNRRTLVHVDDVCAAARLAAVHPAAPGEVFNVTDGRVHTVSEIVAAMSLALGRTPPRFGVPAAPVRAGARLAEAGARAFGLRPPVTRALVDKYTEETAVDGGRIRRTLGFKPAYDLESGWRQAVAEMRQAGRL